MASDKLIIRADASDEGAKRIARRLAEKLPALRCPVCGGREFGLLEQPSTGFRSKLTRTSADYLGRGADISQNVSVLLCLDCGNVLTFADTVIEGASKTGFGQVVVEEG